MPALRASLFFIAALSSASAAAQVLEQPSRTWIGSQGRQYAGLVRPRNGLSMQAVEREFGQPKQRLPAVGQPPISRWVYDQYTVYFEHDRVVHSVLIR